jgi:hypothetical protein
MVSMDVQNGALLRGERGEQLKPYRPRRFNYDSRKRFRRAVRLELLAALGREATAVELRVIQRVADLQWSVAVSQAMLESGRLNNAGIRNMATQDRAIRAYIRELGLGPRRAPKAAPAPVEPPKPEAKPANSEPTLTLGEAIVAGKDP